MKMVFDYGYGRNETKEDLLGVKGRIIWLMVVEVKISLPSSPFQALPVYLLHYEIKQGNFVGEDFKAFFENYSV